MKRASILLIAPLLALTACGGSPENDGGAAARPSSGRSLAPDQARLRYARCLRENGVPGYPDDPKQIPNGLTIPERAINACEQWAQAGGAKTLDPNDPQTRDRFLKLARCMRAHGVDWPDPRPGSLGGPPPDLAGVKNKAKVQAALKTCQQTWSAS
ncbi:MAG TPA: hypothetical protein VE198_02830 [Actinoallomurus sp.]|jgi:hypothetical protein|nr:hypothetical protein [Actinoallomurus sp.]